MNPGYPRILTCPHCGKKKQVLSLASGNTAWMRYWSDNKKYYPYLPQPSFIQKCPYCGGYFLLSRQKNEEYAKDGFCLNEGRLTYTELKEAYRNLSNESETTKEERLEVLFYLLWGFNDKFWRNDEPMLSDSDKEREKYEEDINVKDEEFIMPEPKQTKELETPSKTDWAFHKEIVLELLQFITDPLLRAEFFREIGYFEEASVELSYAEPKDEFLLAYKGKIEELINKQEKRVVELTEMIWEIQSH